MSVPTYLEILAENKRLKVIENDLVRLLKRLREWDHLDTAADGEYWKREIDSALAASDHAS